MSLQKEPLWVENLSALMKKHRNIVENTQIRAPVHFLQPIEVDREAVIFQFGSCRFANDPFVPDLPDGLTICRQPLRLLNLERIGYLHKHQDYVLRQGLEMNEILKNRKRAAGCEVGHRFAWRIPAPDGYRSPYPVECRMLARAKPDGSHSRQDPIFNPQKKVSYTL